MTIEVELRNVLETSSWPLAIGDKLRSASGLKQRPRAVGGELRKAIGVDRERRAVGGELRKAAGSQISNTKQCKNSRTFYLVQFLVLVLIDRCMLNISSLIPVPIGERGVRLPLLEVLGIDLEYVQTEGEFFDVSLLDFGDHFRAWL